MLLIYFELNSWDIFHDLFINFYLEEALAKKEVKNHHLVFSQKIFFNLLFFSDIIDINKYGI